MTLTDLMNTLPNGFHDSIMKSANFDYRKHEAQIDLSIWVGDPDAKDKDTREAYEEAKLVLSGLLAWVVEPPDYYYVPRENENLRIDIGPLESLPDEPPIEVPSGLFGNWIYVNQWNSFIYVVAKEAKLEKLNVVP